MKALRSIALASFAVLASCGSAHANLGYVTSLEYKDVKFKIDQCVFSGSRFSLTGWFKSDSFPATGELKIYLVDQGKRIEVPLEMISRNRENIKGFAGSISTPKHNSSFNANIELVEITNGSERSINYSCNSLQAF